MHKHFKEKAMAMALAVAMMAGHIPMNTFAEDQTAQAAEDDGAAAEEAARAAAAAELAAAEEEARAAEEAARAAAEAELAAAQEAARAAAEAAAAQAQEQAQAAQGGSETVWTGPEESINEEESVEDGESTEGSLTMIQYDPSGLIEDADTASKIEYDVTFVVNDLEHVKIYLPDPKSDDPEKRVDVIEAAKDEELEEKKIKIAAGEDEQIFYVVPEEGYVVDEVKTVRERDGRKESTDAETIEEKDGYIVRYLVDDSTSIEITVVSEAADEAPAADDAEEGLVTIDDYETPLGLAPSEPEAPAAPAQEEQEAAEAPEVRRNLVTFEIPEGISLLVYGELAGGNTAYAEDGCIRFGLFAEEGYEISSVLVDHEKEARKTEDGSEYIIEGIQTDETIVSVAVLAPEAEPETEAPAEEPQTEAATEEMTEALTEAEEETEAPRENLVTFEADEGVSVLVDGEPIEEGKATAKDGTILFTLEAEENTQIISVMVDNEIEARQTENENEYIIEGIQTDETIVTITAENTAPEMPEQVIGPLALADGTQVTFYVPEGSLPEGTKAKVIQLDSSGMMDEIRSKANNADLKQECVAAYSFVFYTEAEGAEEETEAAEETVVEPKKALTVQVENPKPETAQDVYYLN